MESSFRCRAAGRLMHCRQIPRSLNSHAPRVETWLAPIEFRSLDKTRPGCIRSNKYSYTPRLAGLTESREQRECRDCRPRQVRIKEDECGRGHRVNAV